MTIISGNMAAGGRHGAGAGAENSHLICKHEGEIEMELMGVAWAFESPRWHLL